MSEHIALYRKYRPQKFSDVRGQDHITDVLKSSLKDGSTGHAYLFAGPRGTGKTSIARILAKELKTTPEDLYEIDGASNRGIDEIRSLKEAVTTLPFSSPKKVYVIDEVHMLTREAFNALLKTLEEPPEFVVFILATTELHKVPDTIVSRCQTFTFKKPTEVILKKVIQDIAKEEGVKIDDDAAALLSFLGDGSFRDTQGGLEQVLSLGKKSIEREDVEHTMGVPKKELILSYIEGITEGDTNKGLESIAKAEKQNIDMALFAKLIMRTVRFAMLIRLAKDLHKVIEDEVGESEFKELEKLGKSEGAKSFPDVLRVMIDAYNDIKYSYVLQLPLELALIKLTNKES